MEIVTLQVASSCAAVIVGSALLVGGIGKLRDLEGAALGVLDYRVLRWQLALPAALAIAVAEFGLGLGTLLGFSSASALSILLLAVLSLVALSALARGLDIDCHCGGNVDERLGMNTLVRNAFLMTLLAVGLVIPSATTRGLLNAPLAYVVCVAIGVATTAALFAIVQVEHTVHSAAGTDG